MDLGAMQKALRDAGIDGWLFYDFHHRDAMAYSILGLDMNAMTSRRWFYFVPKKGDPVKLSHRVEPRRLDALPGRQEFYLPWKQLHDKLREIVGGASTVAMQYSPTNDIPYVSVVDAGTIELIRSCGPEVVSSADLVQQFEAVYGEEGYRSHCHSGERVQRIKDEAFALMGDALAESRAIREVDVMQFILDRFKDEGLTSEGDKPIVGFNDHPADPHYEPTVEGSHTLKHGDTILMDLWARKIDPVGVFYDITWCGFAGDDPPARYVEIFRVVADARDAALEYVRNKLSAGDPCPGWEVDQACRAVVEKAGYGELFLHRTGHSIGTSVHGNGANIDNLETRDTRMIVPGTCFSIEPGIYLAGEMAVRTEIDVYVRDDGSVEVFGPIQQDLLLIG